MRTKKNSTKHPVIKIVPPVAKAPESKEPCVDAEEPKRPWDRLECLFDKVTAKLKKYETRYSKEFLSSGVPGYSALASLLALVTALGGCCKKEDRNGYADLLQTGLNAVCELDKRLHPMDIVNATDQIDVGLEQVAYAIALVHETQERPDLELEKDKMSERLNGITRGLIYAKMNLAVKAVAT